MKEFGSFCLTIILAFIRLSLKAWMLTKAWQWIIMPLFNVKSISYNEAWMLVVFLVLISSINFNSKEKELLKRTDEEKFTDNIAAIIVNLIFFGVAWLIFE